MMRTRAKGPALDSNADLSAGILHRRKIKACQAISHHPLLKAVPADGVTTEKKTVTFQRWNISLVIRDFYGEEEIAQTRGRYPRGSLGNNPSPACAIPN